MHKHPEEVSSYIEPLCSGIDWGYCISGPGNISSDDSLVKCYFCQACDVDDPLVILLISSHCYPGTLQTPEVRKRDC
jgi:hypothetical protein